MAEPTNLLEVLQTPRRNIPAFPTGKALSADEARKATVAYEGDDESESSVSPSAVDDLSALVVEDEKQQGEETELREASKLTRQSKHENQQLYGTTVFWIHRRAFHGHGSRFPSWA